jgi:hypothetical protein
MLFGFAQFSLLSVPIAFSVLLLLLNVYHVYSLFFTSIRVCFIWPCPAPVQSSTIQPPTSFFHFQYFKIQLIFSSRAFHPTKTHARNSWNSTTSFICNWTVESEYSCWEKKTSLIMIDNAVLRVKAQLAIFLLSRDTLRFSNFTNKIHNSAEKTN